MKVLMDLVLRLILIAAVSAGATMAVADEGDEVHQILFKDDSIRHAAHHGDLAKVNALLDAGVKPNQVALRVAVAEGYPIIVETLLDAGANPENADKTGRTDLMIAAGYYFELYEREVHLFQDRKKFLRLLNSSRIADPPDKPLLAAYVEIVEILLAAGANPNSADNNGWTALMHAAKIGSANTTRILIKAGADVNAANADGWTALDIALDVGDRGVARILRKAGAEE